MTIAEAKDGALPLVSILLPTYNRAAMLDSFLRELSRQTYPNYQVVVVNDGSTDDTGEVIARWTKAGVPIDYHVNERNLGGSVSYQRAFGHSRGDYILIVGDDDLLHPEALSKMMAASQRDRSDIVYCDLALIDAEGKPSGVWSYRAYPDYRELLFELLVGGVNRIPECPLLTRAAFEVYTDTYVRRFVNTYYLTRLRELRFSYLPEPLYYYRVHAGSAACDMAGMWKRNKAVFNHLNSIIFMYAFDEFFPNGQWPREPAALAAGYAALSKVLYRLGCGFVEGEYYNGLTYRESDGLFLPFFKFAGIWLEKALALGARDPELDQVARVLAEVRRRYQGLDLVGKMMLPEVYRQLPAFALMPPHKFDLRVALDVLVLGDEPFPEELVLLADDPGKLIIKVHRLPAGADPTQLLHFLRRNLVHLIVCRGHEPAKQALSALHYLKLYQIPVLAYADQARGDDLAQLARLQAGCLSRLLPRPAAFDGKGPLLGLAGYDLAAFLADVRQAFGAGLNF